MDWGQVGTIVGLLGACLVALLLVLIARREAESVRRRATEDVASIKDEARSKLSDADRRERRLSERELALAQDRDDLDAMERRVRERAEELAAVERTAARAVDAAERAAARTVADAERAAATKLVEARLAARARGRQRSRRGRGARGAAQPADRAGDP